VLMFASIRIDITIVFIGQTNCTYFKMPTSGEVVAPYIPRYNILFQDGKVVSSPPFSQAMTAEQFVGFDCIPPESTPSSINTNFEDLKEIKSRTYVSISIFWF